MGNTCTKDDSLNSGRALPPYYDIKIKGCPSDPNDYFSSIVSSEVKRRHALDHIRFTIAQRRKDQAFGRPLATPCFDADSVEVFVKAIQDRSNNNKGKNAKSVGFINAEANNGGESASASSALPPAQPSSLPLRLEGSDVNLVEAGMAALSTAADAHSLTDPFQPNLIDKSRVVPELEEATHERIVAALVRAKEAVEAAFFLPMEAIVVEPEVRHGYVGGAVKKKGGGILKRKSELSEANANKDGSDDTETPTTDAPSSQQAKEGEDQDGGVTTPATTPRQTQQQGEEEEEGTQPPSPPTPPPLPPPVVQQTCIPWQVARLSWLTTLELVTMDTGSQLLPGQTKHTTRKGTTNRNSNPAASAGAPGAVVAGEEGEEHEFSMLRSGEGMEGGGGATGGQPNAPELIKTPSSTVEVAFASFPLDASVERMLHWSRDKQRMQSKYEASVRSRGVGGGGDVPSVQLKKKKKTAGFKDEANADAAVVGEESNGATADAAANTNTTEIVPATAAPPSHGQAARQVEAIAQQHLSHYRASLLARKIVEHERIRKLYTMIATRPLTPTDHPMYSGLWSNPSSPHVAAVVAARCPQLSTALHGGDVAMRLVKAMLTNTTNNGSNNDEKQRREAMLAAEIEYIRSSAALLLGGGGANGGGAATVDDVERSRAPSSLPQSGFSSNSKRMASANAFNAEVLRQLRRNTLDGSPIDLVGADDSDGGDINASTSNKQNNVQASPQTNRNTRPAAANTNKNTNTGNTNNRSDPSASASSPASSPPHCPSCMCHACAAALWSDMDLRHLINWPPTACVARPTISVLSQSSAIEAMVLTASSATATKNPIRSSSNNNPKNNRGNTMNTPHKPRARAASKDGGGGGNYSDDDKAEGGGGGGGDNGSDSENGSSNTIRLRPLTDGDDMTSPNIQFVRHHKATVLVLFYHHRLKSSNALQRRLLSEDTVAVPLLQPEASASSSMLLGKGGRGDDSEDGNSLLARKARLQMLSNYRELRTQHLASELERRKKIAEGQSLNGGGKDVNGAATLPDVLAAAANDVSRGTDAFISSSAFSAATADNSPNHRLPLLSLPTVRVRQQEEVNAAMPLATAQKCSLAIAYGGGGGGSNASGAADSGSPSTLTLSRDFTAVVPNACVSAAAATAAGADSSATQKRKNGGDGNAAFIAVPATASVRALVLHKNALPHYPPNGLMFSSSRSDGEVLSIGVGGGQQRSGAAVISGGESGFGFGSEDAQQQQQPPIGPQLRNATMAQPLKRLDAVDLVVEAMCINLEAYELIDADVGNGAVNGSQPQHMPILSTLAPAVDLCAAARMVRRYTATAGMLEGGGRSVGVGGELVEDDELLRSVAALASSPTTAQQQQISFQEPLILTHAAARGAVSKKKIKAEKRKGFDSDDFINGRNNRPDSKAQDNNEEAKTSLAIMMMASHYQTQLEEQWEHQRRMNHPRGGNSNSAAVSGTAEQQLVQKLQYLQHDMSQFQSYLAQVAAQVQNEVWMKDLFPL